MILCTLVESKNIERKRSKKLKYGQGKGIKIEIDHNFLPFNFYRIFHTESASICNIITF